MTLRTAAIGLLAGAMVCAPFAQASAHGFRHHGGHSILLLPFEAVGAVARGAVAIVTAPIAIVAGAARAADDRGDYYDRDAYDNRDNGYYGRRDYDRGGPGYYNDPRGSYDGPPSGYGYPQRDAYYGPPQGYGPPPDNYRDDPRDDRRAYNDAPPGYYSDRAQEYGPPPGYPPPRYYDRARYDQSQRPYNGPPSRDYAGPPDQYGPPPNDRRQSDDDEQ